MRHVVLTTMLVVAQASAHAQVLITEVQVDPDASNDDGEWVEIQNLGPSQVRLGDWTLTDFTGTGTSSESATRWTFLNVALQPGEVIVVTKFAGTSGYADNLPIHLFARPASFECGSALRDDQRVLNLVPVGGGTELELSDGATGDAIVLRDNLGDVVSAVEYGSVDRSVPGLPVIAGARGTSLQRVATTGSSLVDFQVASTPDPFVGYVPGGPTPPVILGATSLPRHFYRGPLTVTATIIDADGVASVTMHMAQARSPTLSTTSGFWSVRTQVAGRVFSGTDDPYGFGQPTTFHDMYVHFWVEATDTPGAVNTDPPGAFWLYSRTPFYWRNVMADGTRIAEARTMLGNEPQYRFHSVRVVGIALTRRVAFVEGRTNFFIQGERGDEAIRVFASDLPGPDVNPGDLVRVTGLIDQVEGTRQISEPALEVDLLFAVPLPVPISDHTIGELLADGEALESRLVRVRDARLDPPVRLWPSGGTVIIDDGTGTIPVRVANIVDLAGTAAPSEHFDIVGILGQVAANNVGGYQPMPRDVMDVSVIAPPMDAGFVDAAPSPDAVMDGGAVPPLDDAAEALDAEEGHDDAAEVRDAALARPDASTPPPDATSGLPTVDPSCGCAATSAGSPALLPALCLVALLYWCRSSRSG